MIYSVYPEPHEPTAEERALITHPMTDVERREFGDHIERISARYRSMTPEDVDRYLDKLGDSHA